MTLLVLAALTALGLFFEPTRMYALMGAGVFLVLFPASTIAFLLAVLAGFFLLD